MSIVAVATAVRLFRLDFFSYGLDEILQSFWLHGTWRFFWKSIRFDAVHPPLDYLLGRTFELLQPSDWVRKIADVAWGVGTVAALAVLIRRRVGTPAGVVAALLLAAAPFHVRYSQELRPYALGCFLLVFSLIALDFFLERPSAVRLIALYAACLATAYTLYLAAVVLAIAGGGVLLEDAVSADSERKRRALRFLVWSPLFCLALFLGYLPWLPVVLEAARRAPPVASTPLTWDRAGRTVAFFGFSSRDGLPFRPVDLIFIALAVAGCVTAIRTRGARFLAVWSIGGFAVVETLWQLHPHWDATRRYLPAGLALPAVTALAFVSVGRSRIGRPLSICVLAIFLLLNGAALRSYFRDGRPDWRPLGQALRARPSVERLFTENQYSQICVAYFVVGPQWLYEAMTEGAAKTGRPILNLEGEIQRLTFSWDPGTTSWLVISSGTPAPDLRHWATQFRRTDFPAAEGAVLYRLDPAQREAALRGR
ncbi:MAG: glycosyltransferase family 39 protein [Acidobacteriota bacterium]